jgi:hypothetical protein
VGRVEVVGQQLAVLEHSPATINHRCQRIERCWWGTHTGRQMKLRGYPFQTWASGLFIKWGGVRTSCSKQASEVVKCAQIFCPWQNCQTCNLKHRPLLTDVPITRAYLKTGQTVLASWSILSSVFRNGFRCSSTWSWFYETVWPAIYKYLVRQI